MAQRPQRCAAMPWSPRSSPGCRAAAASRSPAFRCPAHSVPAVSICLTERFAHVALRPNVWAPPSYVMSHAQYWCHLSTVKSALTSAPLLEHRAVGRQWPAERPPLACLPKCTTDTLRTVLMKAVVSALVRHRMRHANGRTGRDARSGSGAIVRREARAEIKLLSGLAMRSEG